MNGIKISVSFNHQLNKHLIENAYDRQDDSSTENQILPSRCKYRLEEIYSMDELPFVFVISSYNNAQWVKKNLDSIFTQKYENYRVIYIDDGSQDGTTDIVKAYIQENSLQNKITLIKNSHRRNKLYNIYNAFHSCKDYEIIAQLDGDDWLAHDGVLTLLNTIFKNKNVWLSYGQFKRTSGEIGPCREIGHRVKKRGLFKKGSWITSHLKVFYAWLFKMVKLQNLLTNSVRDYQGKYYPVANDCATTFPMLEMARERIWFNHHIIYIFNTANPISAHNSQYGLQQSCACEIKNIPIYPRLQHPLLYRLESFEKSTTDCFIISLEPRQLEAALIGLEKFLHNTNSITVLYQKKSENDYHIYQMLKKKYKNIIFFEIVSPADISHVLKKSSSDYLFFTYDTNSLSSHIYCQEWITHLERTFAYACYGKLKCSDFEKNKIPYQHITNNVYAWKFLCDKNKVINPNNIELSLYRKQDIVSELDQIKFLNLEDMLKNWTCAKVTPEKIGLFFDSP